MSSATGEQVQDALNQQRPENLQENPDGPQSTLPTLSDSLPRQVPEILDDGITELWSPRDPTEILADIYFVHGLTGHPFKTWRHKKASPSTDETKTRAAQKSSIPSIHGRLSNTHTEGDEGGFQFSPRNRGCYWPFDLLPNDFDNVRVFTCGYNARPTRFLAGGNQMTLSQHAQNLLQRIKGTRTACRGRPIVFVAHGLGGILVKDVVLESAKYKDQPALRDISDSCSAIFFFGTPHRGSDAARYAVILGTALELMGLQVNKSILRALQHNSETLSAIEGDFNDRLNEPIPASEKIQICSVQEGRSLTGVKLFPVKKVNTSTSKIFVPFLTPLPGSR